LEEVKVKRWALLIGLGLALFPVHNVYLTNLTIKDGEVGFFLPAFGAALWMMGTLLFITWNWEMVKQNGLGDKKIFIPLLIVVLAIGLSGVTAEGLIAKFVPLLMGLSLFSLYLVARILGNAIFLPLVVGAVIASFGVIVSFLHNPGELTGGVVFEENYDIVVGYVLLGVALFIHRYQWVLVSLALVAMFLSGSAEAVFALGVLGLVVLMRRDWGKKMAVSLSPAIVLVVIVFASGYGQVLYDFTVSIIRDFFGTGFSKFTTVLGWRWYWITVAFAGLSPFGDGFNLTAFNIAIVHNVPLIIVQQLGYPGVLAGITWLFVSIYCLLKTKYKYVWVLVLALSVFDHYIWTQLAPLWWAIIGVSTASQIKSDLIFRNNLDF